MVRCEKCRFWVEERCYKNAPGQVLIERRQLVQGDDGEFERPMFYSFAPMTRGFDGCFEGEPK